MEEFIYVGFPNLDPEKVPTKVVLGWNITNPEAIGDTVFFWVGSVYCQMSKNDYVSLFGEE